MSHSIKSLALKYNSLLKEWDKILTLKGRFSDDYYDYADIVEAFEEQYSDQMEAIINLSENKK